MPDGESAWEPEATPKAVEMSEPGGQEERGDQDAAGLGYYSRQRQVGRVIGGLLAVGSLVATLDAGAEWDMERVTHRRYACTQDVRKGVRDDCSAGFAPLAMTWPWTRADAIAQRYESAFEIDAQRLQRSLRLEFDATRERNLRQALVDDAYELAQTNSYRGERLLWTLSEAGAHEHVVLYGTRHDWVEPAPSVVSDSALLTGQLERASEVWQAKDGDLDLAGYALICLEDPFEGMLRISGDYGVWAPSYGKQSEGRRIERQRQLLEVACAGKRGQVHEPDAAAWIVAHEATKGWSKASAWLEREGAHNPARAQVIAQAVMRESATPERVLGWLDGLQPRDEVRQVGRGLLVLRHEDRLTNTYGPQTLAEAAARLAHWARTERDAARDARRHDELERHQHAADTLWRGAAILADEAGIEWNARGQTGLALQLANESRAWHTPAAQRVSVGIALQAGDAEGALAWISQRRAQLAAEDPKSGVGDPHETSALLNLELRALTQLSRWEQALTQARAHRHDYLPDDSSRQDDHLQLWICALEFQLDQLNEPDTMCYPRWGNDALENLMLPLRTVELGRRHRLGFYHLQVDTHLPDLAAILVGGQTHNPEHAERWMDVVLQWDVGLGRELLWARAEAARWRGDLKAEGKWNERLDRLQSWPQSEEQALLLHLAGV